MPRFSRHTITVTTDSSGDATQYIPPEASATEVLGPLNGEVRAVIYTKVDFDNGVDLTITTEETGLGVWTEVNVDASATVHPQVPASDQAGVAMAFAAAGEAVPSGPPVLAEERLKIVVASGGNVKTGTFTLVVG